VQSSRNQKNYSGDTINTAGRLRERTAGLDVRELDPVHGDFNLDLCRLGLDSMRLRLAGQLVSSDVRRFLA
jgi:hypothetical protein